MSTRVEAHARMAAAEGARERMAMHVRRACTGAWAASVASMGQAAGWVGRGGASNAACRPELSLSPWVCRPAPRRQDSVRWLRLALARPTTVVAAWLVATSSMTACATSSTRPAPSGRPAPSSAEVLAASAPTDWRPLDLGRAIVLQLEAGAVVIELAPAFAPRHVANILTLVRSGYFDGLAVVRVQDNYVVQWGDADGKRDVGAIDRKLPDEYSVATGSLTQAGLRFVPLPDGDVYAPEVGFVDSLPVGRNAGGSEAWIAHCYGSVGVGRDMPPDNGLGNELYVVSGHAPRHLDRNLAVVGRVVQGMDLLTSLPRGKGPLGFYERPEQRVPIRTVRVAADLPPAEQPRLELLRTDTATFSAFVAARRSRREAFFVVPTDRVELCNIGLAVRPRAP